MTDLSSQIGQRAVAVRGYIGELEVVAEKRIK